MAGSLENRGKLRELIDKFQFVGELDEVEKGVIISQIVVCLDWIFGETTKFKVRLFKS